MLKKTFLWKISFTYQSTFNSNILYYFTQSYDLIFYFIFIYFFIYFNSRLFFSSSFSFFFFFLIFLLHFVTTLHCHPLSHQCCSLAWPRPPLEPPSSLARKTTAGQWATTVGDNDMWFFHIFSIFLSPLYFFIPL